MINMILMQTWLRIVCVLVQQLYKCKPPSQFNLWIIMLLWYTVTAVTDWFTVIVAGSLFQCDCLSLGCWCRNSFVEVSRRVTCTRARLVRRVSSTRGHATPVATVATRRVCASACHAKVTSHPLSTHTHTHSRVLWPHFPLKQGYLQPWCICSHEFYLIHFVTICKEKYRY